MHQSMSNASRLTIVLRFVLGVVAKLSGRKFGDKNIKIHIVQPSSEKVQSMTMG